MITKAKPIPKPYYSLAVRIGGIWSVQFGSYSKQDVIDECEDSYNDEEKTKIIKTADNQEAINNAIKLMNLHKD